MRGDRLLTGAIIVGVFSVLLLIGSSFVTSAATPQASEAVGVPAGATNVLRLGDQGAQVATVQQALVDGGWPTWVDGDFGPHTEATVRLFQRANGLTVDGLVGPATSGALGISSGATASQPAERIRPPAPPTPPTPPPSYTGPCAQWAADMEFFGLPPAIFGPIMWRESRCDPSVTSNTGCCSGLLQVHRIHLPKSICGAYTQSDLYDPIINLCVASILYKEQGVGPWQL